MQIKVPFLDLKSHHAPLRSEFNVAIQEVIDEGAFAGGPFVARFEADFAAYCDCPHAIGVGSGTEALWLSLLALGVGPGDDVITVPNTFMATAEAISYCGARPVFVDVDERTYTMDPTALEKALTAKTKAIIPVHLFGQPADMDPILEIAREHGLFVIEDACQAHGAEYKGRKVGTSCRRSLFQLLSWEESWRLRRSRRGCDLQRRVAGEDSNPSGSRPGSQILPQHGWMELPDGRNPGGCFAHQTAPSRKMQ